MLEPFLLYNNSSSEGKKPYYSRQDIIKDLNMDIIFRTMAREDNFVAMNVRKVIMVPLETPGQIIYRQDIIKDFYNNQTMLEAMYECVKRQQKALAVYKEETEKNRTRQARKAAQIIETLKYLGQGQDDLIFLSSLLDKNKSSLKSEGLMALMQRLGSIKLQQIKEKIDDMDFFVSGGGAGYTFQFGGGLKIGRAVVNYCSPVQNTKKKSKKKGFQKLYDKYIKKNSIQINSNELLQKDELNITLAMPEPQPLGTKDTKFKNLYELSMAVYLQKKPVGNNLALVNNLLLIITGANQGGKSTFLRSYGLAQVLMQCGLPVPADSFSAPVYHQVFTHFTRREDEQLNSGRLQEELKRISDMVNAAEPYCLFLLNESFASTTEKEGSQIAEGILHAFYDKEITTVMVTHLFQLARNLYNNKPDGTSFLVAERKDDGTRTFKMLPGEPGYTSYGTDLFKELEEEVFL